MHNLCPILYIILHLLKGKMCRILLNEFKYVKLLIVKGIIKLTI